MNVKHCFSAANILSAATRENCMKSFSRIPSVKMGPTSEDKRAAVLVPLCYVKGEMSLLFTVRSMELKSHKGHVAFPGGKFDKTDGTLLETALRESEEELGIHRDCVEVWGSAAAMPSKNFELLVTPIIGYIKDFDKLVLKPSPSEVAEVFTVSLEKLADPQYFEVDTFKNGFTIPVFKAGPHKIWGLTAVFTHLFLSCLFSEEVYPMQFKHINYSGSDIQTIKGPKSSL